VPPHNLSAPATGTGRNQSCLPTVRRLSHPRQGSPPTRLPTRLPTRQPAGVRADLAQPPPRTWGRGILVSSLVGAHAWRTPPPPATAKPATIPPPR
jgi:hypothetical protein